MDYNVGARRAVREALKASYLFMTRFALWTAVAAVVAWIVLLLTTFYYTLVMRDFIDYLVALVGTPKGRWLEGLMWYAGVLAGMWVAKYVLNVLGEYLLRSTAISTLRGLAMEFVWRLMRAKPGSVPEKGDVIGRFISDLARVSELGGLIPSLLVQAARLAIGALLLYVLNVYLFILALVVVPAYYLMFRVSSRRLAEVSEQERREFAAISSIVKNVVDSLLFVRLYRGVRSYLWSQSGSHISSWSSRLRKVAFYDVFFNQSFNSLYDVLRLVVLVVGGFLVAAGSATVGSVVAFSTAVYGVYEPVANISYTLASLGELHPYLRRVREVLEAEVEEEERGEVLREVESIELRDVSVAVGGKRLLNRISAVFRSGRVYAIVGPTGSGKTTLLLTLVRYFEPSEGLVLVNGVDYRDYSLSSLRSRIVYVPQTPLVFRASLRDNVTLGNRVPEDVLRRALILAKVDFVKDVDSVVDPDRLSDGQKQRIALARALAVQPDVLLLDEALNAVDEETEAYILSRLREEVESGRLKMVIVVTHRSSTLRLVDHVYTMEPGGVLRGERVLGEG